MTRVPVYSACRICGLATGLILAASTAHANLLANGSFESGTFTPDASGVQHLAIGTPGPLPLAGWTLFVGDIFWVGTPNAYSITASDGGRSMNLYDPFRPLVRVGSVQQTIASTPGARYELSFDVGANAAFASPTAVQAQAAGQAANFYNSGASDWVHHTWSFTAFDTTTVIYFQGLLGDGYIGLDNAVLTLTAVPEPAPWLLGLAGLATWTLQAGRKRRLGRLYELK